LNVTTIWIALAICCLALIVPQRSVVDYRQCAAQMSDSNGVAPMSKPDENDKQPDPPKLLKGWCCRTIAAM